MTQGKTKMYYYIQTHKFYLNIRNHSGYPAHKKCHISIQRPAKVYSSNTEQWLSTNVYYKIIIFPRNSCIFPQSVISVPHIRWEAQ